MSGKESELADRARERVARRDPKDEPSAARRRNVALAVPPEPTEPTFDDETRIGHLLEPIADTFDDNTRVGSPAEVDSSAPPTQPKGKRGVISLALEAPIVLKPAPALLPMSSDTPTKERQRARG